MIRPRRSSQPPGAVRSRLRVKPRRARRGPVGRSAWTRFSSSTGGTGRARWLPPEATSPHHHRSARPGDDAPSARLPVHLDGSGETARPAGPSRPARSSPRSAPGPRPPCTLASGRRQAVTPQYGAAGGTPSLGATAAPDLRAPSHTSLIAPHRCAAVTLPRSRGAPGSDDGTTIDRGCECESSRRCRTPPFGIPGGASKRFPTTGAPASAVSARPARPGPPSSARSLRSCRPAAPRPTRRRACGGPAARSRARPRPVAP